MTATAIAALLVGASCTPIAARQPDRQESSTAGVPDAPGDLFSYDPEARPLRIGEAVPDITLTDAAGRPFSLTELHGRVVVLTFFAVSGAPEDAEMLDRLDAIAQRLTPAVASEVTLLAVMLDPGVDVPQKLRLASTRPTVPGVTRHFVWARPGHAASVAGALQVAIWQTSGGEVRHTFNTVIIDRRGRLADRFPGFDGWSPMDVVAAASSAARR